MQKLVLCRGKPIKQPHFAYLEFFIFKSKCGRCLLHNVVFIFKKQTKIALLLNLVYVLECGLIKISDQTLQKPNP